MIISFHIPETGRIRLLSVPDYKSKWSSFKTLNSIELNEFSIDNFPEKSFLWLEIDKEDNTIGFVKMQISERKDQVDVLWFLADELMWLGIEPKIIESLADYCMTIPEIKSLKFTTLDGIWDELFLVPNKEKKVISDDIIEITVTIDHKKSAQNW